MTFLSPSTFSGFVSHQQHSVSHPKPTIQSLTLYSAGTVTAKEYREAKPDPIMAFGSHIADHMNDDHQSATIAMVKHYIPGLDSDDYVKEAVINRVDSLGMDVKITRDPDNNDQLPGQPQQFKVRLPFPKQVTERGDVKVAIMEMTNASAEAAKNS